MNNKNTIINISLVILSALLLHLASFRMDFLIWFALVPFIILAKRNNPKENLVYAITTSVLMAVGIIYWSFFYKIQYGFYLTIYVFSFFFIYEVLLNFIFPKFKNIFSVLLPAFLWVFLSWLYSYFVFGSFWFNLSIFQVKFSFVNQALGEVGFTFLIIFFNSLISYAILEKNKSPYILLLIFIVLCLFPAYYYGQHKTVEGKRVRVALIQGNFTQKIDWRVENAQDKILNRYIDLTREACREKPDLVVWPEYAIPVDLLIDKRTYDKISDLARELKINLIVGSLVKDKKNQKLGLQYDSVFAFDREGNLIDRYDALKPFPIGAKSEAGSRYVVLNTDAGRIGISVCLDEVYDKIYQEYNKLGVDYFVSLSNNTPSNSKLAMKLIKRFSELRASTYNKYFIRSSNSGFSEVIDPFGNIINKIPEQVSDYAVTDIYIK